VLAAQRFAELAVDVPNDRSLHATSMPRTGGLGLLIGACAASVISPVAGFSLVVGMAAALAAIFFVDDRRGLPISVRIFAQAAAATIVAIWGVDASDQPLPLVVMLVPCIVWSMNAFNFMDGTNGLAGGMAVIGFGAYAVAGHWTGVADLATVAAIVSGAALGFLFWNFGHARIFLGDAGSIVLGFLAVTLGVVGWQRQAWPSWFPLLVFSPFVLDATVTLLRRALRGENVLGAHKTHYYQRLVRMGWSHRRLALAAYALMFGAAGSALLARHAPAPMIAVLLCAWGVTYAFIAVTVDRWWSAFQLR
jgi:UDP-N-acetylmuramyl pentapeptide phosphotransferase/UDP-N-acetylglucosamine-1-phosphate transferase